MGRKKLTTSSFIERAIAVHGDRYDYSRSNYLGSHEKIEILCKVHGTFYQKAGQHFHNGGCDKCGRLSAFSSVDEFIEKAQSVHGDLYDYSEVVYVRAAQKVRIICRTHGVFEQTPNCHLTGNGCKQCADGLRGKAQRKKTEKFIAAANLAHGEKYDYSQTVYTTAKRKVEIVCRDHGVFTQKAESHTQGSGCPLCASVIYRGDESAPCLLYYVKFNTADGALWKVGVTAKSIERRFRYDLTPEPIWLMEFETAKLAIEAEKFAIGKYSEWKPNWGKRLKAGNSETFSKDVGLHPIEIISRFGGRLVDARPCDLLTYRCGIQPAIPKPRTSSQLLVC